MDRRSEKIDRIALEVAAQEAFWRNVDKRGPDECWNWTGHMYRNVIRFYFDGVSFTPRRLAFGWARRLVGIRSGVMIHVICKNYICCNPRHLCEKGGQEHFWSLTKPVGDCRIWTGTFTGGRKRNGVFVLKGEHVYAGKVAYMFSRRKKKPPTKKIFKTCGDSRCCEPSHLYIVEDDRVKHFLAKVDGAPSKSECWIAKNVRSPKSVSVVIKYRRSAWKIFRGKGLKRGFSAVGICGESKCCSPWHSKVVRRDKVSQFLTSEGLRDISREKSKMALISDEGVRIARWLYSNTPMEVGAIADIFGLESSGMWHLVKKEGP